MKYIKQDIFFFRIIILMMHTRVKNKHKMEMNNNIVPTVQNILSLYQLCVMTRTERIVRSNTMREFLT